MRAVVFPHARYKAAVQAAPDDLFLRAARGFPTACYSVVTAVPLTETMSMLPP